MTKKIDGVEIDFNARAFGEDPVTSKVDSSEDAAADASQAKSGEEGEEEQPSSGAEPVVDEQKVPYSRMKAVIERARQSDRDREDALGRLAEYERGNRINSRTPDRSNEPYADAITNRIKKLYGYDEAGVTDAQRKIVDGIIETELNHVKTFEDIAERKALEVIDRRDNSSRSEQVANERAIEENIEDFSLNLGRDLTDDEEANLLEIADKYSPVGDDGKYLSGEPLPLDRAWEIYEMQLASKGQQSKKARSQATAATSARSDGETTVEPAQGEWYPGRWRDRFNKK